MPWECRQVSCSLPPPVSNYLLPSSAAGNLQTEYRVNLLPSSSASKLQEVTSVNLLHSLDSLCYRKASGSVQDYCATPFCCRKIAGNVLGQWDKYGLNAVVLFRCQLKCTKSTRQWANRKCPEWVYPLLHSPTGFSSMQIAGCVQDETAVSQAYMLNAVVYFFVKKCTI